MKFSTSLVAEVKNLLPGEDDLLEAMEHGRPTLLNELDMAEIRTCDSWRAQLKPPSNLMVKEVEEQVAKVKDLTAIIRHIVRMDSSAGLVIGRRVPTEEFELALVAQGGRKG